MNTASPIPVHMTLCGKGGVGKSVIARILNEYLIDRGAAPLAFDSDPVNASFAAVEAFDVTRVQLIDADQKINPRHFDEMVLDILKAGRPAVIDTGASSFVALMNYMRELGLAETFRAEGHELFLHVPIAGGPSMPFTVENFGDVCSAFGSHAGVVVWLNHFWERIELSGKPFDEWQIRRQHRNVIRAVVEIQRMSSDTSAQDFTALLKSNRSFADAVGPDSPFHLLSRSRLWRIRQILFDGMDAAFADFDAGGVITDADAEVND